MKNVRSISLLSAALGCFAPFASACAPSDGLPAEERIERGEPEALAAVSSSTGSLTITLQGAVRWDDRNGNRGLVIKGRSNRNLDGLRSWVPDDVFGEATLVDPKRFEIFLREGYEANTILSGLPLNVTFDAATGTTRTAYAQIRLGASFARFSGSSMLFLDKEITPVFVRSDVDNLRYRSSLSASRGIVSASGAADGGAGDPVLSRIDADTFRIDWQYPAFALASDPHTTPVSFDAVLDPALPKQKRAGIDVVATGIVLTTEDPEIAFATSCDPDVYACVQTANAAGELDLGHCGTYRQVQRCEYADPCEVGGTSDYELTAFDASGFLGPIETAYAAECQSGFTWCSADVVGTYNVPACLDTPATLDQAVEWIAAHDQSFVADGATVTRVDVAGTSLFTHGTQGPALLAAFDQIAQSTNVTAYLASYEIPCHNCHTFGEYLVLFYPDTGVVFVVQGTSGYDS